MQKLLQITQERTAQPQANQSLFGHVLGYKLDEDQVFGLGLAESNTYSVYYSVAVYVADLSLDDQQIIDGVCEFIKRKNGKIVVVQASATSGSDSPTVTIRQIDLKCKDIESKQSQVMSFSQYVGNCITVRVRGELQSKVPCPADRQQVESQLQTEIDRLTKVNRKTQLQLINSEYTMNSSINDSSPITELYSHIEDEYTNEISQIAGSKKARQKMIEHLIKQKVKSKELIEFRVGAPAKAIADQGDTVTAIEFKEGSSVALSLPIDFIFQLDHRSSISSLARLFDHMFQSVLKQVHQLLLPALSSTDDRHVPQIRFYNFWHRDSSAAICTIAYPTHLSEEQLIERRRSICNELYLPLDRPSIRRANAFNVDILSNAADRPLLNPHLSLLGATSKGKYHIVQGSYLYHHYMQDGFNDNGWGCAYRSLQTLISWFALQGYAQVTRVPNHAEIQKVLVEIGDKPSSFVGSKQWIGSQEVGFVLNQLYQIDSKFMCVSSGSELESKGRQLANHFDSQGTPIMIGGGNLAHTILGVDFNEDTGKLRFLVLDPHYTGSEDLNTILKKASFNRLNN
jgi:hypothetical protein